MSDYLWDKKGEPDAEVARLEALLGAFAHEPRTLELPAEAAAQEPPPATLLPFAPRLRAPRLFAPAALAAAAALVVASVLVASVLMRARVADEGGRAAVRESSQPAPGAHEGGRAAPREAERVMLEPPPPPVKGGGKVEIVAAGNLPQVARHGKAARPASVPMRRQKGVAAEPPAGGAGAGEGLTLEAMGAGGGASSLVENARLLTKEQLVYALRLTGAKLKDVRERAQGRKAEEDRP